MNSSASKRTAAILAAGLGSRLQSHTHSKPLLLVKGRTLLDRMILQLAQQGFERIVVAIREELLSADDIANLPKPKGVEYILVNTPSSLHTLGECLKKTTLPGEENSLFVTMVDTILQAQDFALFCQFCKSIDKTQSALLATKFIDDENPLYVDCDQNGRVSKIGKEPTSTVTAGMYYLSASAQKLALEEIKNGTEKMRNFLSSLITNKQLVNLFVIEKSLDLDRPEDLIQAENFV